MKARKMFLTIVVAALFVVGSAGGSMAAVADFVLFDVGSSSSASISFTGGTNPLTGSDIPVTGVKGSQDDSFGTLYEISNGMLNFTTGPSTGDWNFAGGGQITLTGGIPAFGITNNETLFSGIFTSALTVFYSGFGLDFALHSGGFDDSKHDGIVGEFFPGITLFLGNFNIYSTMPKDIPTGDPFSSTSVIGGFVANTPVPIPSALLLLGTGLIGFIGLRRKFGR